MPAKSAKFSVNSNFEQLKIIQGHRCWCQSKANNAASYKSLIVILTNLLSFSRYWRI